MTLGLRTFSEPIGGPANAMAINKDGSLVAVAGRHVFKVFEVMEDERRFKEIHNLRTAPGGKNLNLNYSCTDVVWNPIESHILATAATNGAVVIWNLEKSSRSKLESVYQDHTRTVNKVSFHPQEHFYLLSGSQDGTMKLFDLRKPNAILTFESSSESVRDVQFAPKDPYTFCAVQENGNVQLWDFRRNDRYKKQFTAHSGPVFACDWHPTQKSVLATAGRDKLIKVWDLNKNPGLTKGSGLESMIQTIAPVERIKWRPGRTKHIASCSLVVDYCIYVWDTTRPYVPFAAFTEHKDVATGFEWRKSPKSLISAGKDGCLIMHVMEDADRPCDRANPIGLTFNPHGDIAHAVNKSFCRNQNNWGKQKSNSFSHATRSGIFSGPSNVGSISGHANVEGRSTIVNGLKGMAQAAVGATGMHFFQPHSTSFTHKSNDISPQGVSGSAPFRSSNNAVQFSSMATPPPPPPPQVYESRTHKLASLFKSRSVETRGEKFLETSSLMNVFNVVEPNTDYLKEYLTMDWFIESALRYKIQGKAVQELCEHNAQVAFSLNRPEVYRFWLEAKALYPVPRPIITPTTIPPSEMRITSAFDAMNIPDGRITDPTDSSCPGSNQQSRHPSGKDPIPSRHSSGSKPPWPIGSLDSRTTDATLVPAINSIINNHHENHHGSNNRSRHESAEQSCISERDHDSASQSEQEDDPFAQSFYVDLPFVPPSHQEIIFNKSSYAFFFGDSDQHFNGFMDKLKTAEDLLRTMDPYASDILGESEGQDSDFEEPPAEAFAPRHKIEYREIPPEMYSDVEDNFNESDNESEGGREVADFMSRSPKKDLEDLCKTGQPPPVSAVQRFQDFFVEKAEKFVADGDVQTAATGLIIFQEKLKNCRRLPDIMQEFWLHSYVDLLSRYELWNVMTEVIGKCGQPNVSYLNQVSTTMRVACGLCGQNPGSKQLRNGHVCDEHKELPSKCAVCNGEVIGVYLWCQGCGHGGHIYHLYEWFSKNEQCITGCGHRCEFT